VHGSQLNCQGKAIHLFANGCHLVHCIGSVWSYSLGSLTKERHRILEGQRSQEHLLLGTQAQRRLARHEDRQAGATRQQISNERCTVQDLLDIVKQEQEMLVV
jgi:hypothetical protein